jgi:hypothetical protein
MKHISPYHLFESEGNSKPIGLALFLHLERWGDPYVLVSAATGPDFFETGRAIIERFLDEFELDINVDYDEIGCIDDIIDLFEEPHFYNQLSAEKVIVEDVKVYRATPRDNSMNTASRAVKARVDDPDQYDPDHDDLDYDPMDMRDKDDEDSIPSLGWETDDIISLLYQSFKADKPLFTQIALGQKSNVSKDDLAHIVDTYRNDPMSIYKLDHRPHIKKRVLGALKIKDLSVLGRSLKRGFLDL